MTISEPTPFPLLSPLKHESGQSAWTGHFGFAQRLIRDLRPPVMVELGVHHGDSYFCMTQAVQEFDTNTVCFGVDTWAGDPHAGLYGDEVFSQVQEVNEPYESFSHLLRKTFDEASVLLKIWKLSLLHIDGYHTYEAVKHDYETWGDKVSDIILFHDTHVFKDDFGVHQLWAELCERHPGMTFEFPYSFGLGVLCKSERARDIVAGIVTGAGGACLGI